MCESIPEEYEILISGYLDGELDVADQQKLEAYMAESPACRREFEAMKSLLTGTEAAFKIEPPADAVWDAFLDSFYNRSERRTGWWVLILGVLGLFLAGLYWYVTDPFTSCLIKMLIAVPVVGLVILFISVLRQRLRVAKSDRYSKEVQR